MADKSLAPYKVNRLRMYVSSETVGRCGPFARRLAALAEEQLKVDGSSIVEQLGRWKGEVEAGYVVEVYFPAGTNTQVFEQHLQMAVDSTNDPVRGKLTVYVAYDYGVTALEVL